jgi:hypothetical protein
LAEFPNDLTAIMAARDLAREGETIEVWRETTLVYRSGSAVRWDAAADGKKKPAK